MGERPHNDCSDRGCRWIFATDLGDAAALEKARAVFYPVSIEADVSPERLRRFFTKLDGSYRIDKQVRDLCVFAKQNITIDPPFSRVDLITCRNVLIYMSPPLQERLLPVLHFALNREGFLVLGMAETVGRLADLFTPVNAASKIYQRRETTRSQVSFTADEWVAGLPTRANERPASAPDFQREADDQARPGRQASTITSRNRSTSLP